MVVLVVLWRLISSLVSIVSSVSDAAIAVASLSPIPPPLPAPRRAQVKGVTHQCKNIQFRPRRLKRAALWDWSPHVKAGPPVEGHLHPTPLKKNQRD